MSSEPKFHYDLEHSEDASGWKTVTIHFHGRLVSENTAEVRALVAPLILQGGHILLDLTKLDYLDSSGLGALVSLKVSAINRGLCKLELVNLTPRVKSLLTMTNLLQLFSQ
jgi:anti-sigma B factor antagonist